MPKRKPKTVGDPIGPGTPAYEHSDEAARQLALMYRELDKHGQLADAELWTQAVCRDARDGVLSDDDVLEV